MTYYLNTQACNKLGNDKKNSHCRRWGQVSVSDLWRVCLAMRRAYACGDQFSSTHSRQQWHATNSATQKTFNVFLLSHTSQH